MNAWRAAQHAIKPVGPARPRPVRAQVALGSLPIRHCRKWSIIFGAVWTKQIGCQPHATASNGQRSRQSTTLPTGGAARRRRTPVDGSNRAQQPVRAEGRARAATATCVGGKRLILFWRGKPIVPSHTSLAPGRPTRSCSAPTAYTRSSLFFEAHDAAGAARACTPRRRAAATPRRPVAGAAPLPAPSQAAARAHQTAMTSCQ